MNWTTNRICIERRFRELRKEGAQMIETKAWNHRNQKAPTASSRRPVGLCTAGASAEREKLWRLKFDASLVLCAFLIEWGKQHGRAAHEATEEVKFALLDLGIEPSRLMR
jgi:hypothetical protein